MVLVYLVTCFFVIHMIALPLGFDNSICLVSCFDALFHYNSMICSPLSNSKGAYDRFLFFYVSINIYVANMDINLFLHCFENFLYHHFRRRLNTSLHMEPRLICGEIVG